MGRSSSTGLPFLIERPDTRKFAYHRVVASDLAPLVVGPLDLLWASKIIELRRRVPIHPELIALGFLRYVAGLRAGKSKYVFPQLRDYRGRRTHDWSKWWGRYGRKYVTKS